MGEVIIKTLTWSLIGIYTVMPSAYYNAKYNKIKILTTAAVLHQVYLHAEKVISRQANRNKD